MYVLKAKRQCETEKEFKHYFKRLELQNVLENLRENTHYMLHLKISLKKLSIISKEIEEKYSSFIPVGVIKQ